jgi:hypothetical protein
MASISRPNPPARTTAEARLMIDIRVEIEAIAYRPPAAARAGTGLLARAGGRRRRSSDPPAIRIGCDAEAMAFDLMASGRGLDRGRCGL